MCSLFMQKKFIRLLLAALSIVAIIAYYPHFKPEQSKSEVKGVYQYVSNDYKVITIEDGDTITVDMNGKKEKVRFIGVDTPETKDPRKAVQCFGKSASEYTKQKIGNNTVRLESDELNTNRDRYKRLLRYVYLPDGTLLNATIIKDGYGFAYTSFPFSKKEEFKQLETEAREQKRGLWSTCQPKQNKYGGYTSNPE